MASFGSPRTGSSSYARPCLSNRRSHFSKPARTSRSTEVSYSRGRAGWRSTHDHRRRVRDNRTRGRLLDPELKNSWGAEMGKNGYSSMKRFAGSYGPRLWVPHTPRALVTRTMFQ
ncbi:unnamed protein product [Miscanthus lutarioriparius]|uniref:Uncharacterized protein n=1 Tax=Miscanthus lutarioriparius TaxID=422564 RepID=A0A811S499_9POAL|nr:unnamed protein product [Miscanthus lutarioriparius]